MTEPTQLEKLDALIVEFGQSRNDIHWKVYAGPDGFIRWGGYDDDYWWAHVSKTDHFRNKIGKVTGRLFTLDPDSHAVTVSGPEARS